MGIGASLVQVCLTVFAWNRYLASRVCDAKACSFQCFRFFLVIFYVGGPLLTVQAKYAESLL